MQIAHSKTCKILFILPLVSDQAAPEAIKHYLPEAELTPYPVELLPEVWVAPGVDGRVVAGAGHGHQMADKEHQVVKPPTF